MKKITNINTGACQSRMQLKQPCLFVNWQEDGKNNYKFFEHSRECCKFEDFLIKQSQDYEK